MWWRKGVDISRAAFVAGVIVVAISHVTYAVWIKEKSLLVGVVAFFATVVVTGVFSGLSLRSMWGHPIYGEAQWDTKKYPTPRKQVLAGLVFIGLTVGWGFVESAR